MAELSWHEQWLLYSSSEGRVAVFDTDGLSPAFDLSAFALALPGAEDGTDREGSVNLEASSRLGRVSERLGK